METPPRKPLRVEWSNGYRGVLINSSHWLYDCFDCLVGGCSEFLKIPCINTPASILRATKEKGNRRYASVIE